MAGGSSAKGEDLKAGKELLEDTTGAEKLEKKPEDPKGTKAILSFNLFVLSLLFTCLVRLNF